MQLNPSALEQVTAATNLPLALVSLAAMTSLYLRRQAHPLRAWLWIVLHLVQLPGLLCLLTGVQIGLGPKPEKESNAAGMFPHALRFP